MIGLVSFYVVRSSETAWQKLENGGWDGTGKLAFTGPAFYTATS